MTYTKPSITSVLDLEAQLGEDTFFSVRKVADDEG